MSQIVLVADDSMTIQRMATELLTEQGLEVLAVANGVAAIRKLATVKPLLVLADVDMPGRDGYEVCDFVKRSAELSDVPVILVFSDTDPYDQERAAAVRADAVVKKPFVSAELLARVREFAWKPAESESSAASSDSAAQSGDQTAATPDMTRPTPPAEPASLSGIPEGAALSEPEPGAVLAGEAAPDEPPEAVAALALATPAPTTEMPQHAAGSGGALFARKDQVADQVAVSAEAPEGTSLAFELALAQHCETPPSFAGAEMLSAAAPGAGSMEGAEVVPVQENAQPFFMLNSEAAAGATASEPEVADSTAQEPRLPPDVTEGRDPTLALPESVSGIASSGVSGDDRAGTDFASPHAGATSTRLGDWKLAQTTPASVNDTSAPGPILAALPDLAAPFPFPLAAERVDQAIMNPWQALDIKPLEESRGSGGSSSEAAVGGPNEGHVSSRGPEAETSQSPALEELSRKAEVIEPPPPAGNEPSRPVAADAPSAPMEEDSLAPVFSEIAGGQCDRPPVQRPPLELAQDAPPCHTTAHLRAPEVGEPAAIGMESQHSPILLPRASDNPASEPDLAIDPAAPVSTAPGSGEDTANSKIESSPQWDVPSEATLHQAFLEAALSRTAVQHSRIGRGAFEEPSPAVSISEEVTHPHEGRYAPALAGTADSESGALQPAPARTLNGNLVESIVARVVVRMAPSALSPEFIQQMVEKLTAECLENIGLDPL